MATLLGNTLEFDLRCSHRIQDREANLSAEWRWWRASWRDVRDRGGIERSRGRRTPRGDYRDDASLKSRAGVCEGRLDGGA